MVPRGTFIGYKNTSAIRTPLRNVNGYKNTLSAERTVNKNVLAQLSETEKKETGSLAELSPSAYQKREHEKHFRRSDSRSNVETKKRTSLTLQQKIDIIRAVESQPHKNKTAIAKEKDVPRTTLMNIMKNKLKYKEQCECGKEVLSRKKSYNQN